MARKWTWKRDCSNALAIICDGVKVADIVADNELSDEDFENARFIVEACKAKEKIKC